VWLAQGRLTEAVAWVHEAGLSVDDDLDYVREFETITLARVLIALYQSNPAEHPIHEAIGLLERLLNAAEEGGRQGSAIEILILQALAYEAQGHITLALSPLERALSLAELQAYLRIFVDEGRPMAHLLAEAAAHGLMLNYVHQLQATFARQKQSSLGDISHFNAPASQPLIEPLTDRELEILQLVAEGLSNREICDRLFLALSTVKGHNRNIFDKLHVKRRTEAVARARELGLL
jgi:LuxR family maltose regulon positive regulatory protein